MSKVFYGVNIQHFTAGWWGEHSESNKLLQMLGLPPNRIPFCVEWFLRNRSIILKDAERNKIMVWFTKNDIMYEFHCIYKDRRRHIRLYREWETVDVERIVQLESYSIGECARKIIMGESIV